MNKIVFIFVVGISCVAGLRASEDPFMSDISMFIECNKTHPFMLCHRFKEVVESCSEGEIEKWLLALKPYINWFDIHSSFTMVHAAAELRSPKVLQMLIENGGEVNAGKSTDVCVKECVTPLFSSVLSSQFNIHNVEILCLAGADVNIKNAFDKTVLHYAVQKNNLDLIQVLLTYGADVTIQDHRSQTPLDIARRNRASYIIDLLTKTARWTPLRRLWVGAVARAFGEQSTGGASAGAGDVVGKK